MVGARTVTALVGLAASLLLSVALWWYFDSFLFFLFIPFVPFLFRGGGDQSETSPVEVRTCPACGFQTGNEEFEYCPRDGRRLERRQY